MALVMSYIIVVYYPYFCHLPYTMNRTIETRHGQLDSSSPNLFNNNRPEQYDKTSDVIDTRPENIKTMER